MKQYGILFILNHSTLSQSELILVLFISYNARVPAANKLAFDCTFQCKTFEKNFATDLDHD